VHFHHEAIRAPETAGIGRGKDYQGENRFLVQADPASTPNKSGKAKRYGTNIISAEQLMQMLGQ
jgi:hypothetical protein